MLAPFRPTLIDDRLGHPAPLETGERGGQPSSPHWLDEIIDRLHIEGRHRVFVIGGGGEDHAGRVGPLRHLARKLDTVHDRHADVGEHQIDRLLLDHSQGLGAVGDHPTTRVGCSSEMSPSKSLRRARAIASSSTMSTFEYVCHGLFLRYGSRIRNHIALRPFSIPSEASRS